jgi:hypothetical protein
LRTDANHRSGCHALRFQLLLADAGERRRAVLADPSDAGRDHDIAVSRSHPNAAPIAIVTLFLGWTLVGYVIALAWSFSAIDREKY